MQILAPAGAAALLAIPAILVLYILKVRRPEVRVPSLLFWPHYVADRQADAPWQRLRRSVLLLIQLLVATALALALMRPGLPGRSAVARTTVVMIDGSPSMMATDVAPTRFGAAVARARRLGGQLGGGKQMAVVLLGDHARLLAPPTSDQVVINAALDRARPSGQVADLGEGISVANAVLANQRRASVILMSDGHAHPPASVAAARLAAPLVFERIGRSGDNAAMGTMGRTPTGDVFFAVANLGPARRDVKVEMRADGRLVDVVPVTVEPHASAEHTWSGLPAGTRVLEARLTPDDDLSLDDAAWLVTEPAVRRWALLVTPQNGFLQRALALRPDVDVTTVEPSQYRPGPYDMYIFDRFVPPPPLPHPSLVIAPPEGSGPVPSGPFTDPGAVLPANPREPLLQYVSLRDVHVQAASTAAAPPGWRTVIAAVNGPLLLVHQGEPRLAQLTFDVHRSDLPLRPAFPVLVQNLVSALLPGSFESQVFPLGTPVRLVTEPGVTSIDVSAPDGRSHRLTAQQGSATITDTTRPGVYTVRQASPAGVRASRFIVQLTDADQSRITPGAAPMIQADAHPPGRPERGTLEIWKWVAVAAILGLAVEWLVFLRG